MVDHPSAALLIRVWLENAGEFRARLLTQRDVASDSHDEQTVALASSPRHVLDAVRAWLDDFTRQAVNPVDDGDG